MSLFCLPAMAQTLRQDELRAELLPDGVIRLALGTVSFETLPLPEGWSISDVLLHEGAGTLTWQLRIPGFSDSVQAEMRILEGNAVELTLFGNAGKDALEPDPIAALEAIQKTPERPKTMPQRVAYPPAWRNEDSDRILLPLGEGVAFPVVCPKDADPKKLELGPQETPFWSRGLTMAFFGIERGDAWLACGIEDASDAMLRASREETTQRLSAQLIWLPERGRWGYARRIRWMVGTSGGVTAACKAYRHFREKDGFGRTLAEKQKQKNLPQLSQLYGAANVWLWHDRYDELMYADQALEIDVTNVSEICRIAREMRDGGLDRAIWGIFFTLDSPAVAELRKLGFLVTKYDNYQDVMPPELQRVVPARRIQSCDYTVRRNRNWPADIQVTAGGQLAKAWALRGTDGKMHPQNSMCVRQAPPFIRNEVGEDARKWGYDARFIDVLGIGLAECFSPTHPMTRRTSRLWKEQGLSCLGELGLISGTEEGIECLLPHFEYSEGKMSLFPYRINPMNCGRLKANLYSDPETACELDQFMLNPQWRVPLWELVYHECSVNYWYWGDSSNCVPDRLEARDRWNALYSTPPLYSFKVKDWERLKPQILASYARTKKLLRRTAAQEMTHFRYLTPDRTVQQTEFADGTTVTVNFSGKAFLTETGTLNPGETKLEFPGP